MAKVDEKMFFAVKTLRDNGATIAETAKYMKLSTGTVKMITRAEDYGEYKNILTAVVMKKNEQRAAREAKKEEVTKTEVQETAVTKVIHEQTVTIQATHYMMQELKQTNEYLRLICNKLGAIIDDLYGTGEKK